MLSLSCRLFVFLLSSCCRHYFVIVTPSRLHCGVVFISGCVLDAVSFKKRCAGRADHGFPFYMELSQFVYRLLSRSRKSTSLPLLNSWQDYMDSSKVADFEKISSDDFPMNYEFGNTLRSFKGGESREFRRQRPDFMDRFVDVIMAQNPAS